jgi:hypothetical protein
MCLEFLCSNHRNAFLRDSTAALAAWDGYCARLEKTALSPTPYRFGLAGSAVEAAEIFLLTRPRCDALTVERYVDGVMTLLMMLFELKRSQQAIVVVARSRALLQHIAVNGGHREAALTGCAEVSQVGLLALDSALTRSVRKRSLWKHDKGLVAK